MSVQILWKSVTFKLPKKKRSKVSPVLTYLSNSVSAEKKVGLKKFRPRYYIVIIYSGPKCHGNFNFTHGNFNLLAEISIFSRQFQFALCNFNFTHGNINLLTAISICSRQFQFPHGNFNLPTAISICSRQF